MQERIPFLSKNLKFLQIFPSSSFVWLWDSDESTIVSLGDPDPLNLIQSAKPCRCPRLFSHFGPPWSDFFSIAISGPLGNLCVCVSLSLDHTLRTPFLPIMTYNMFSNSQTPTCETQCSFPVVFIPVKSRSHKLSGYGRFWSCCCPPIYIADNSRTPKDIKNHPKNWKCQKTSEAMAQQRRPCLDLTAVMTVDQWRPQNKGLGHTSNISTVWYSKNRNGTGTGTSRSFTDNSRHRSIEYKINK